MKKMTRKDVIAAWATARKRHSERTRGMCGTASSLQAASFAAADAVTGAAERYEMANNTLLAAEAALALAVGTGNPAGIAAATAAVAAASANLGKAGAALARAEAAMNSAARAYSSHVASCRACKGQEEQRSGRPASRVRRVAVKPQRARQKAAARRPRKKS